MVVDGYVLLYIGLKTHRDMFFSKLAKLIWLVWNMILITPAFITMVAYSFSVYLLLEDIFV